MSCIQLKMLFLIILCPHGALEMTQLKNLSFLNPRRVPLRSKREQSNSDPDSRVSVSIALYRGPGIYKEQRVS